MVYRKTVYCFADLLHSMFQSTHLSNLQLGLLKLFSSNIGETDLLHIKQYLAKYFIEKAIHEADVIWAEKGYRNEPMDQWLNKGCTK